MKKKMIMLASATVVAAAFCGAYAAAKRLTCKVPCLSYPKIL